MLSQIIWWGSTALEVLLLARGVSGPLLSRYPVFYLYLLLVLIQSPIQFVAYHWSQFTWYPPVFWVTEFVALAMGCLVIFEIYRVALEAYPGTAKMARRILLFLFALSVAKAAAALWSDPHLLQETTALQVERALRTAQAFAIVALVTVFASYSIPFGKNLRGILLGYGLFVGERVICLTFVPSTGRGFWFYAYSASYLVAVGTWLVHLWSYQPVHAPAKLQLENEYQAIATATYRRLRETRGNLRKAVSS